MPIFDVSRIRRSGWKSIDELADELATVLDSANKGISAPLVIRCVGDEPAIKILAPDADLTTVPPIQIRSGGEIWMIPAWPSDYNPIPLAGISGEPTFTPVYHGAPFGNSVLGIETTASATIPDPREEDRLQMPLTLQGKVTSTSPLLVDVYLADPSAGVAWLNMPATDRSVGSALSVNDPVVVTIYWAADDNGAAKAFIA